MQNQKICLVLGCLLAVTLSIGSHPVRSASGSGSVLTYHGDPGRSGHFVVPGLTWQRARGAHLDPKFRGEVSGHIYAQPLYWHPAGSASSLLIVATEDDWVYALDAANGTTVWKTRLGKPAPRSSLPCGNIDPLGITGTPVIDERYQAVYLDAVVLQPEQPEPQHLIFALSVNDGLVLPGWPVNVARALQPSLDFSYRRSLGGCRASATDYFRGRERLFGEGWGSVARASRNAILRAS